ncbi:MAG: HEAT repeat domain-containing protein [Spirochaetia bacterium]
MKTKLLIFLILVSIFGSLAAQEAETNPHLDSYLRNFARASLSTKLEILQNAEQEGPGGFGPLYMKAIDFVLGNQSLLGTDSTMRQLSVLASSLVGEAGFTEGRMRLWQLFEVDDDTAVRIAVLRSLSEIAGGDMQIIAELNRWVSSQNTLFLTGENPNYQVLAQAVTTLGELGDPSSFPILFTTKNLRFSETITEQAEEALFDIDGEFKDLIIQVIEKNVVREKLSALNMALETDEMTNDEKGEVAERALGVGLETSSPDATEKTQLREIRFTAIRALTERNWSRATPLVIRHFDITIMEHDRGIIRKDNFLEAISALGSMATHEAAVRLNLYLDLLNTYKEQDKQVDEQIILEVIGNLGKLGDKVATDNLLYVGYLNYSQTVRNAAREALGNLKQN